MRKKRENSWVGKPNALLYFCVAPVLKLFYRLYFHQTLTKQDVKHIKPPYLVVMGHASWLDFAITSAAMFPRRMNYVGAYNFFRNPVLKRVMTFMGVIPKFQFTNDIAAIKKIKYCINQGRVVALFPHGCLSNDGRPGGYAVFGIAKLIKHLKVPVVMVKTNGAYLTRPRWTTQASRGKLETRVFPLLTANEIDELSAEAVYARVLTAIDFDDYRWQRENRVVFKGKRIAEGVEYVLYKCPKCQSEFTLRSKDNRLICSACGNAVRMNAYRMFEPETQDTAYFDGIDTWYDFQSNSLAAEIERDDFCLSTETELLFAEPGKFGYQHQGYGTLTLTKEAFTYSGSVKDEPAHIVLPLKQIPMIPYAANEYIEVAIGPDIHRFVLSDLRQGMKWVLAVRQIRDKYYEEVLR